MTLLASILGFCATIVAAVLLYGVAYQPVSSLVQQAFGGRPLSGMENLVIGFVLLFIFISVATRLGRFARDWIEAGKRVVREPAK